MKIAYILPIDVTKYDGVLNKVTSQVEAWENQGEEVVVFLITKHKHYELNKTSLEPLLSRNLVKIYNSREIGFLPLDLLNDWLGQKSIFSKVLDDVKIYEPDIVYARNSLFHPFYGELGKRFKLILELNTDMESEYKLQSFQSIKYFLRFLYYKLTNKFLLKGVAGLASVTYDIANNYIDIPIGVFPNSINVNRYRIDLVNNNNNNSIRILFIGSPGMPWHGVDILIDLALKLDEFYFDVVGISKEEFPKAPKNVLFHGYLNKKNYLKLFTKATATIASLAFYRNNMLEACPLKVREYLACCKPVILPYKDTAFEQKGYPEWVLQLPNSREGILGSSEKIRTFLNSCDKFNITKEEVKKFVHVDNIEKDRLTFFRSIVEEIDVKQ